MGSSSSSCRDHYPRKSCFCQQTLPALKEINIHYPILEFTYKNCQYSVFPSSTYHIQGSWESLISWIGNRCHIMHKCCLQFKRAINKSHSTHLLSGNHVILKWAPKLYLPVSTLKMLVQNEGKVQYHMGSYCKEPYKVQCTCLPTSCISHMQQSNHIVANNRHPQMRL